MNIFGDLVKKALIDKHMTQIELGTKIGMEQKAINSLLNRDNISLGKMIDVANGLDCDLVISLVPKENRVSPLQSSPDYRKKKQTN